MSSLRINRRHVVALAFMGVMVVITAVFGRAELLRLVTLRTSIQVPASPSIPSSNGAETPPAEQASAVQERYEAIFSHDPVDIKWTEQAKALVDSKLTSLLPKGSAIRSIECHTLICRLETTHQDRDRYFQFARRAFLNTSDRPWDAATYSAPPSGNPADGLMVTYIAREGQPLPATAN